jgi:predicted dehydrogenase
MTYAIIGTGRMGKRHIQAAKKCGLDLIALHDVNGISLKETVDEFGLDVKLMCSIIDDLYSNRIPDVLIISTTADSHCDLVCQAAEQGVKYILVEKPLAVSIEQCQTMIETCEKYGSVLSVNHQMRFMDQYILPKTLLNSSPYGGFRSMTVVAGNFGMSMNGTHYIEAFRFLCDEDPHEVTAWFDDKSVPNPRGIQFEDKAGTLRITTKSGKRFYLEIGSDQGHGMEVTYAARNGHIHVSELYGELFSTVRKDEFKDLPTTRYGMPADRETILIKPVEVVDSTAEVLKALLNDDNRVTAEQGMLAVKVLAAAYQSAENGNKPVKLVELNDSKRVFPWA